MNETVQFDDTGDAPNDVIDLNKIDMTPDIIPRGRTGVIVDDFTYGTSQRSGNPMFTWVLEVEDGEHAGRKLYFHTVLAGNGLPRSRKTLQRVAPDIFGKAFKPQDVADSGVMIGKRLSADVSTQRYEGEMRNNVKDLYPIQVSEGGGDNFFG